MAVPQQQWQVFAASGPHCNMCNIPIYPDKNTCIIRLKQLKHLQHLSETPENT
jgi:hypothetical protein